MADMQDDTSPTVVTSQVANSEETSGFICDVGYSTEHYFNTIDICEVCKKHGYMIVESGWVGSRWLHANKVCRGYFEVDDSGVCWKRQVTPEIYDMIVEARDKALERDKKAEDATGRKCETCGTTRGIDYYGMYPDPLSCFCKPCHTKWIGSHVLCAKHGLDDDTPGTDLPTERYTPPQSDLEAHPKAHTSKGGLG